MRKVIDFFHENEMAVLLGILITIFAFGVTNIFMTFYESLPKKMEPIDMSDYMEVGILQVEDRKYIGSQEACDHLDLILNGEK